MSKITSNTCIFIVTSFFFTLEKISKEVMYHIICVNYDAKIEAGPRAGAGPKSGSGSSQIFRLRAAPKPCILYTFKTHFASQEPILK